MMWAPRQRGVDALVCEGTWEPLPHFVGWVRRLRLREKQLSCDNLTAEAVSCLQGGTQLRTHCPGASSPRQPYTYT